MVDRVDRESQVVAVVQGRDSGLVAVVGRAARAEVAQAGTVGKEQMQATCGVREVAGAVLAARAGLVLADLEAERAMVREAGESESEALVRD